jgi:hypothetical protein
MARAMKVTRHYFWFHVGWDSKRRDFGVTVYLKLEQGKIWIEEDWKKRGIANDLLEAVGVQSFPDLGGE